MRSSWAGPVKFEHDLQSQASGGDERPGSPVHHGKGKHARRMLLTEKDMRTLCRNAEELLLFHERFVEELKAAVGDLGFSSVFSPNEGDAEADARPFGRWESGTRMGLCLRILLFFCDFPMAAERFDRSNPFGVRE